MHPHHKPQPVVSTRIVIVDDTDTSINYDNNWISSDRDSKAYNGTSHTSCKSNSSFTFNFTGTAVRVSGTLKNKFGQPSSSYFLDGVLNQTFIAPHIDDDDIHQVLFFSQAGLPDTEHGLEVILNNGNHVQNDPSTCIFVDFLEYAPSLGRNGQMDPSAGVIAGAVLAVVAALLAGIGALLLWRRIGRTKRELLMLQRERYYFGEHRGHRSNTVGNGATAFPSVYVPSEGSLSPTGTHPLRGSWYPRAPSVARSSGSPTRLERSVSHQLRPFQLQSKPPSTAQWLDNRYAQESGVDMRTSSGEKFGADDKASVWSIEKGDGMGRRPESPHAISVQKRVKSWYAGTSGSLQSATTGKRSFWAL